ncbi:hypothetical protein ACQY1Q_04190 [Tenacibaculum sp. TC6]|uniref:hypothetical protein n=1 Tax=Tenacibaculum sp. TC6 TaxID=3423223 RepID=UPI003D36DB5A
MKKIIYTLVFVFTSITFCNAQKIETEKIFGGYRYTQNGKTLTMNNLTVLMQSNKQALELLKKAKTNNTLAYILGGAGGILIGIPLGQSIGGGEANWTLAAVGAGIIVTAIPIASSANKKTKQAIELYNSSLQSTSSFNFKPEFTIIANGNGIGISMHF